MITVPDSPWSIPGITQRLIALHAEGMIMRDIADRLNFEFLTDLTRNAVIGKCRRLAMPEREAPVRERKPRIYKYKPRDKPKPPRVDGDLLTIYQTGHGDCRYPVSGDCPYLYCGKPSDEGRSYCPTHHALTHFQARKTWE